MLRRLLLALVAVSVVAVGAGAGSQASPRAAPAQIRVGGDRLLAMAAAFGDLWVTVLDGRRVQLVRVDPRSGRVRARIRLGSPASGCCHEAFAAPDGLWVAGNGLVRVSPRTNRVVARVGVRGPCDGRATAHEGSLWRTSGNVGAGADVRRPGFVCQIDPRTGVTGIVRLPSQPLALAAAGGRVWVALGDGSVATIETPSSALRIRARLGDYPVMGIVGNRYGVWATNGRALFRLDVRRGRVTGRIAGAPAFFAGVLAQRERALWVLDGRSRVAQVDGRRSRVVSARDVPPAAPQALAVAAGSAWTLGPRQTLVRVASSRYRPQFRPEIGGNGRRRAPWCRTAALRARTQFQGATGALAGVFGLRNEGRRACTLRGRPTITVVDLRGRFEPVHVRRAGPVWAASREPSPANWPFVTVPPRYWSGASLWWSNWCGPRKTVRFRAALPNGGTLTATARTGPRCDDPYRPSTLQVGPFE